MKYFLFAIVTVFFFLAFLDCDQADDGVKVLPGAGDYGSNSQPIINGNPPDAPEHDAVVGLHQLTKKGAVYVLPFCSGTLVSPDVVVTAAHCLDVAKATKPTFATMKPSALAIYIGDDPSQDILDHIYFVSGTVIYPSYNRFTNQNDIAVVQLSREITEPVEPVPHLPASLGFTQADVGTLLNIAGFGDTEFGTWGVKLQADVTLGSLGCYVVGCPGPGDADTMIAYQQYTAGPCFGDSGGPAFVYRDSVPYVGGVTSYGDGDCNVYGVSTRVDPYETWINEFVNPYTPDCSSDGYCNPECATGEDPDCDTPPNCSADGYCNPECVTGEDPDCGSNDCGNGVCDEGESCDGRDGTVDCSSDCPGKTTGKPTKRYCFVGDTCEGRGCP